MEKGKLRLKHKGLILSACCLIFILSVVGIFTLFHRQLNEKSYNILTTGLSANTQKQKHRTDLIISNLQEMLDILENTLETTEFAFPIEGLGFVIQDSKIQIDYLEAQQFPTSDTSSKLQPLYRRLMDGEEVITELDTPFFTNEASQFALLHPVFQDGSLIGVLRACIDVSLLIKESINSDLFFEKAYTILTQSDGTIVYADTPYPNGENFFSSTLQGGIGTDEVDDIHQAFQKNNAMTLSFTGKGNQYYMSWESLGFNDWRMVMFARSLDVVLKTTAILRGMIIAGVALIVLTAAFCIVLIHLLLRQKRLLDTQQRRYDTLSQFNDTLLFEYDVIQNHVSFTPNASEQLDLDQQYLEKIPWETSVGQLLHPRDQNMIAEKFPISSIVLGKTYYTEVRLRCRNGEYNWFGCHFKSIENQKEQSSRIIGKLGDINNQREREQVLQQASLRDVLTGIYNRSAEALINTLLKKNPQGLFFMLDLDNFKDVNDTYGHPVGDSLLIAVAQILGEIFRQDDIIARVGGDEFIVFISGINDPEIAKEKAAIIQNRMEHLCIAGMEHSGISASIGASSAPQNGTTYAALTRAADRAMYTIKQQSKKGFAFHDDKNQETNGVLSCDKKKY